MLLVLISHGYLHCHGDDLNIGAVLGTNYQALVEEQCLVDAPPVHVQRALARHIQQFQLVDGARSTSMLIPTYFHILRDDAGNGDVNDQRIHDQLKVMNDGFAGTGIAFEHRGTTRTNKSSWTNMGKSSSEEREAKKTLGVNPRVNLNIYVANFSGRYGGWATFPWDLEGDVVVDGIVIRNDTVPGGSLPNFNSGKIAVHEAGHWLGLFHTFQNGCKSPGDSVDDTPYHSHVSLVSCVTRGTDSCPNRPGTDPVDNYMNYGGDPCLKQFTLGQVVRMKSMAARFRPFIVRPSGSWKQVKVKGAPVTGMQDVAVASDQTVWLIGKDGTVWSRLPGATRFNKDPDPNVGGMSRVAVAPSGPTTMFTVASEGTVWKYDGKWAQVKVKGAPVTGMQDVAVASDQTVWLIGKDGTVWSRLPGATRFNKDPDPNVGGMSRVAVAPHAQNGVFTVASKGTVWANDGGWRKVDSNGKFVSGAADVAVSLSRTVWLTGKDGSIWSRPPSATFSRHRDAAGFVTIAIAPNGSRWGVGANGTVWTY